MADYRFHKEMGQDDKKKTINYMVRGFIIISQLVRAV